MADTKRTHHEPVPVPEREVPVNAPPVRPSPTSVDPMPIGIDAGRNGNWLAELRRRIRDGEDI